MGVFAKLFGVKTQTGDLVERKELQSLYRNSLAIALPSTIEGALLSIIGSMDTMMVGKLGAAAIAAVGLTGQPRMILLICAQALCVGTTAICARRKGAEDQQGANSCLMQSLAVITVLGILMTVLGYFGAEVLMKIAGANEDTMEMSVSYFKIISMGMLFNCWSLCICAAMRGIGQTRITMITNIAANLLNVVLNYILINGKLGFPAMGVDGAAVATLCSNILSCLIAVAFVCHKNSYYHFTFLKFDSDTLHGLANVGSSSVLESVCLRIGFLVNSRLIAGIGTSAFAAYQIVQQVAGLSFTLGDGAATAGTSLVGQSLGAKRKDRAMLYVKVVRKIGMAMSLFLMVTIFLLRRQLALLFTTDEHIITGVTYSFFVVIIGMMSQNGRVIYSGCLRGAGDVKYVAACALVSVSVLRPVLTYFCCYPLESWFPGRYIAVMGPWIAFVIDAFVREWLLYRRIKQGRWMEMQLS